MGYRSDVAYIIRLGSIEDAKEFVALVRLQPRLFKALSECEMDIESDSCVEFNFYTDGVKWYEGYEDVDMHEGLLAFVREEYNEKAAYRYIRIGEQDDDAYIADHGNEELNPWEDFYIERHISMPRRRNAVKLDDLTSYKLGENNG